MCAMDVSRIYSMLADDPKLALMLVAILCFVFLLLVCVLYYLMLLVCECRSITSGQRQFKNECVQCQLIDMGEMACNTGVCPGCGRVPPSAMAYSSEIMQPY